MPVPQARTLVPGLPLTMPFRIANAMCRRRGFPSWVHGHITKPLGKLRHGSAPAESGRHRTLSTSTDLFSDQWNTSELKSRRVWHRSGCEPQSSGCEIGPIADRGEIASQSLGSLFLMHNTCVHSFVYFVGIFRKPYNIPKKKKFKLL